MPITIQEILASDKISEFVDKVNYNFDQLLLNGGGPAGPVGAQGIIGPMGGRGQRGSFWFENISDPSLPPTSITFTEIFEQDNYLQDNGDVWSWNNGSWQNTGINLTGPQGPTGNSIGMGYFGSNIPSQPPNQNAIYSDIFIEGANADNEGVSSLVVGASISTDILPIGSIGNSKISDNIAANISSDLVSLFIHQKTPNTKSIIFHGNNDSNNYEEDNLADLCNISIKEDDVLIINSPKAGNNTVEGIKLISNVRGQSFLSGRHIDIKTGLSETADPISSSFTVQVNETANGTSFTESKISLDVIGAQNFATVELGKKSSISFPSFTQKNGAAYTEADEIRLIGNSIKIQRSNSNYIRINNNGSNPATINVLSAGSINIESSGSIITIKSNKNIINGNLKLETVSQYTPDAPLGNPNATVTPQLLARNQQTKQVQEVPGAAPIPLGGIIMWSGAVNTIPNGWALCDGGTHNGISTPNLTDKFIRGAKQTSPTSDTVGNIGGDDNISINGTISINKLTPQMIPRHHHMFFGDDRLYNNTDPGNGSPGYNGSGSMSVSASSANDTMKYGGGDSNADGKPNHIIKIGGWDADSDNHGHRNAYFTGLNNKYVGSTLIQDNSFNISPPTGNFDGGSAKDNRPKFYTLAFIMYVGQ